MKELIDAEDAARQSRKVAKLSREARFKQPGACIEDVLYCPAATSAGTEWRGGRSAAGSRTGRSW